MSRRVLGVVGDLVEDVIVVAAGPTQHGTDNTAVIIRRRGGSAANVAAMAASSASVRFIGCVGDDATGRALEQDLATRGVDVRLQRRGQTGTVVVIVDTDGERTMYPDRGASALLGTVDDASSSGIDLLHVSAYSLATETSRRVIFDLAGRVRNQGGVVSVDLSAASMISAIGPEVFASLVVQLVPSIIFANRDEMDALGTAAVGLRDIATVVVKNGSRPTQVLESDGAVIVVDVLPVAEVVDTTGAGDAFAAGYLTASLDRCDVTESCRRGHSMAATVLGHAGAGAQRLGESNSVRLTVPTSPLHRPTLLR